MRLVMLLLPLLAPCGGDTAPDTVISLREAGRYAEAAAMARAAGPGSEVALAELLILQGRLDEAEAVLGPVADVAGDCRWPAIAALAAVADHRGDRDAVIRYARMVTASYAGNERLASDHLAAGKLFRLLGRHDPQAVRQALAAFDAATAADPSSPEGTLLASDLLLEHYNAPDAANGYREVLARWPDHPRALLGQALVASFSGQGSAMALAEQALGRNPSLVPARLLIARLLLEAENYDSAAVMADRALAVDSTLVESWSMVAAIAWGAGDTAAMRSAERRARELHRAPAGFYAELAEAAGRHRRYHEARDFAAIGVSLDSNSVPALGALGTNLLRTGDIAAGRAAIERAFALDPFHVWHKNTLDMLDVLAGFQTVRTARFELVTADRDSEILALVLGPLLERGYDSLAARYDFRPETPIRLELFDRHADFSVRTVGLAGLGALGVSFGTLLAMDAPSARPQGEFNVGSTAWHELAHTFTLGASDHRVPRWFSEGLSVLEERRAGKGWGARADPGFIAALARGELLPLDRLNDGFVRPDRPDRVQLSYYQASLVVELLEQEVGIAGIREILRGYAAGKETGELVEKVTGKSTADFDSRFLAWLERRFGSAVDAMKRDGDPFGGHLTAAAGSLVAGDTARAVGSLRLAARTFPEYGGPGSPRLVLAQLLHATGDRRGALAEIAAVTGGSETAWEANLLEAEWQAEAGDTVAALDALSRAAMIVPGNGEVWKRMAELATTGRRWAPAVTARRAVMALGPADPIAARTDLAEALLGAGDATAARRELLRALENAPGYERAQELLLRAREGGQR